MKTKLSFLLLGGIAVLFAILSVGCPPLPVTPIPDASDAQVDDSGDAMLDAQDAADASSDASDSADAADSMLTDGARLSVYARACMNLRARGCAVGFKFDGGQSCEELLLHTAGGAFDMKPECLASAKDAAAVRACKTVKCSP